MSAKKHIGILGIIVICLVACSAPDAESYYSQGRQLRDANQPVEAMNAFIAATRTPSHEYTIKGRAFSNMATMCRIGERHESAFSLYEKSAQEFARAQDSLAFAYALNNMAWEQAVLGHKQQALQLIDSALFICDREEMHLKVAESQTAAYLYAGEYDSVLLCTQTMSAPSTYFAILRAQAFTFLNECDSAIRYAQQVLTQTDNPRYLDDVYYILVHCDSAANANVIRDLAAKRADIQRDLERNDAEWIEAMRLAEETLLPPQNATPWGRLLLFYLLCLVAFALIVFLLVRRIRETDEQPDATALSDLEQQCRALRKSTQLRTDLQWDDYRLFSQLCNTRFSGLVDQLENRGLSEREVRICILVLIGLSYAKMAEFLYRAESGIGKDKYMIAKHLGISAKDLKSELQRIACSTENA